MYLARVSAGRPTVLRNSRSRGTGGPTGWPGLPYNRGRMSFDLPTEPTTSPQAHRALEERKIYSVQRLDCYAKINKKKENILYLVLRTFTIPYRLDQFLVGNWGCHSI